MFDEEDLLLIKELTEAEMDYLDDIRIPDLLEKREASTNDEERQDISDQLLPLYNRSKRLRILWDKIADSWTEIAAGRK